MRRRRGISACLTVVAAVGATLGAGRAAADGVVGGRVIWTFQQNKTQQQEQDAFLQRYELNLRDRLFQTNDMVLSLYLNSSKNFTTDQTLLRYRGELTLSNRYYSFDARYAPRQDITPLQAEEEIEVTEQRYNLSLHVPEAPVVRVYYAQRARYFNGVFDGRIRDLRGDLSYRWKVLEFGLNRWNTRSTNGTEAGTTVTGGRLRYNQSFGPLLTAQAGYEGQLTVRSRSLSIAETRTQSHTFNALLTSAYEKLVWSSLSWVSRRLTGGQVADFENTNDTGVLQVKFLPTSPLSIEGNWNYLLSRQDGARNLSNYATVQAILQGPRRARWHGLAQMAQRFAIEREGSGVIPSNLYYLSLRGNVYRGVDARAELNVSQQNEDMPSLTRRYQSTSLLELYLKPRRSWLISTSARTFKYSDRLYFLKNNRFDYGLTANYFAREYFTGGLDLRRNILTTGSRRQDTSVVVNASFRMRSRSSLLVSYGFNEYEFLAQPQSERAANGSHANSFNLQALVWLTRRGQLSFNYTQIDRRDANDTSYLSLNYTQDF